MTTALTKSLLIVLVLLASCGPAEEKWELEGVHHHHVAGAREPDKYYATLRKGTLTKRLAVSRDIWEYLRLQLEQQR